MLPHYFIFCFDADALLVMERVQHTSRALHPSIPTCHFIVTLYLKEIYWLCARTCLTWYNGINGARVYCQIEGCGAKGNEQACRVSVLHRYYELHCNCPLLNPTSTLYLKEKGGRFRALSPHSRSHSCESDLIRQFILLPLFRPFYPSSFYNNLIKYITMHKPR